MLFCRKRKDCDPVVKELREIKYLLVQIEKLLQPSKASRYVLTIDGKEMNAMTSSMQDNQKVTATISAVDSAKVPQPIPGPAPIDAGSAQWSVSDQSVATASPSTDGTSCDLIGVAPGTVQLSVAFKVNGVDQSANGSMTVTLSAAGGFSIQFGAPVAQ